MVKERSAKGKGHLKGMDEHMRLLEQAIGIGKELLAIDEDRKPALFNAIETIKKPPNKKLEKIN